MKITFILSVLLLASCSSVQPKKNELEKLIDGKKVISSYLMINPDAVEGKILSAGIYKNTSSNQGKIYELIENTTTIPAKKGTNFGFKFILSLPNSELNKYSLRSDLVSKIFHPKIKNPETGIIDEQTITPSNFFLNQENYFGYEFTYEWEAVVGSWRFELWGGDKLITEKTFEVK